MSKRGITYLDVSQVITLYSCNTASVIELDLPDAAEVGEKVADTSAITDVPHLQGPVRPGDDLLAIMLEASDGTSVRAQLVPAVSMFGIPDAERRIRRSRDQEVIMQSKEADKRGMTFKVVEKRPVVQRPHLDHMVHGTTDAPVALVV